MLACGAVASWPRGEGASREIVTRGRHALGVAGGPRARRGRRSGSSAGRSSQGGSSTSATCRLHFAPDYAFAAGLAAAGRLAAVEPARQRGRALPPRVSGRPRSCSSSWGRARPSAPGAALHLFVALAGGSVARRAGWAWARPGPGSRGPPTASAASCSRPSTSLPLFQAAAWAPLVIAALRWRSAERRARGASPALARRLLALQVSHPRRRDRPADRGVALVPGARAARSWRDAACLARLAAPALLAAAPRGAGAPRGPGARWPAPRASGASRSAEALAFSLHPVVLAEAVLPAAPRRSRTPSPTGTTGGAPTFPTGYPVPPLPVPRPRRCCCSRPGRGRAPAPLGASRRPGVLLALGSHGPLGLLPEGLRCSRSAGPQKLLFLAHLALALLAGLGLERALARPGERRRRSVPRSGPGAALVARRARPRRWPGGRAACAPGWRGWRPRSSTRAASSRRRSSGRGALADQRRRSRSARASPSGRGGRPGRSRPAPGGRSTCSP